VLILLVCKPLPTKVTEKVAGYRNITTPEPPVPPAVAPFLLLEPPPPPPVKFVPLPPACGSD